MEHICLKLNPDYITFTEIFFKSNFLETRQNKTLCNDVEHTVNVEDVEEFSHNIIIFII